MFGMDTAQQFIQALRQRDPSRLLQHLYGFRSLPEQEHKIRVLYDGNPGRNPVEVVYALCYRITGPFIFSESSVCRFHEIGCVAPCEQIPRLVNNQELILFPVHHSLLYLKNKGQQHDLLKVFFRFEFFKFHDNQVGLCPHGCRSVKISGVCPLCCIGIKPF